MSPAQKKIPAQVDSLWTNVHLATMTETGPYGMVKDGAMAIGGDKIAWIGKRIDLPADLESRVDKVYDGQNGWITPGLVDCHTHLVYAGSREKEYEDNREHN